MTLDNQNLYAMLFPDYDDDNSNSDDIGHLRISEIFNDVDFNDISKYYDIKSFNNSFPVNDQSSLSVIHFNIRNLRTNMDELEANISLMKRDPDVIALSETWLDLPDDTVTHLNGYKSYHVIRDAPHGGVSLLIKDHLESSLVEKFSFIGPEVEMCTVSIKVNSADYIVSVIYRPHFKHDNIKEFIKVLEPILNDKTFKKSKSILAGDFNINLLEHHSHSDTNDYISFMQNHFYLPVITRPTRFPEGQQRAIPSLLDHIYINFSPLLYQAL